MSNTRNRVSRGLRCRSSVLNVVSARLTAFRAAIACGVPRAGRMPRAAAALATVLCVATVALRTSAGDEMPANVVRFGNDSGVGETMTTLPGFDPGNAFFASLGANGRACVTCHQPREGWSVAAAGIRKRFRESDGFDPIFRLNDGATCPTADVSTLDRRRTAYALLLRKGLIRVGLPIPPDAEFSLIDLEDPYACSTAAELSVYRRPLPSTNLRFLSAVMWDGRETHAGRTMEENLTQQAIDATLGHAQAFAAPTPAQLAEIVDLETSLFTAQIVDNGAGRLTADGGSGGAAALSQQPFYIGINDPIGLNPTGAPFEPRAFTTFAPWLQLRSSGRTQEAQRAIARGQELFDTRPITIAGVGGLNDVLGRPSIVGTCTLCHDTPNVGDHSISMPLDIGISDAGTRTPDLPLYTLRCNATGEIVRTSDPGRALISGRCEDIGKVKGPILRGLAARAPYFHNGSAATLADVVDFYDRRFDLRLTPREKADLVAFLSAL
jgi:processive rubber oxygenase RoxA-like protein